MIKLNQKYFFEVISSTHQVIKEDKFPFGSWFLAKNQYAGIGQNQKHWVEITNENIFFSAKVKLKKLFFPLQLFPILIASISLKAIILFFPFEAPFITWKWINDLYKREKKIAGILVESFVFENYTSLIISIGINLTGQNTDINQTLKNKAGFITEDLTNFNKDKFIEYFINCINNILIIENEENLKPYFNLLEENNYLKNKKISFLDKNQILIQDTIFEKVDTKTGQLILKDRNEKLYYFFESPEKFTIFH